MHYSKRDLLHQYATNPKHKGLTEEQKAKSVFANVDSCEDNFNIYIEKEGDIVKTARFDGTGCAISTASTDIILNIIEGKHIDEISNIINMYEDFLDGKIKTTNNELLDIFEIIQQHRSRRKCAVVALQTIREEIK